MVGKQLSSVSIQLYGELSLSTYCVLPYLLALILIIKRFRYTGHNAPLYGREEEDGEESPGYLFSVFDTLKIWLDAGAPPEKTLMGFAQYGRGMTLETEETGIYCPAKDGKKYKIRLCIWI